MHDELTVRGIDLNTVESGQSALRVFFRIAAAWGLTDRQQVVLLGTSDDAFAAWKQGRLQSGLDHTTLERLSYVLGIYASLQILLPIPVQANAWVTRPNAAPMLGGQSALSRMLGGSISDLLAVREYLDAQLLP